MSRKLLVLSSIVVAMVAVSFDTTEAEAGRCCRNRGRRCCNMGYASCGHYHGGCNIGYNTGCNTGCVQQVAYNNCGTIQGCGPQGCPVQSGRLMAQPNNGDVAPPPPAPSNEPLAPAAPTAVQPAP